MPELPEVETSRRGIEPYLLGATITHMTVRRPALRWPIPQEIIALHNVEVRAVRRRAKYLLIDVVDKENTADAYQTGTLLIHLGMSGSLRIVDASVPVTLHDHIDMQMNNGKILRYNDPRRFGCWLWHSSAETHPLLAQLGPEPLTDAFNADYFYTRSQQRKTAIKAWLMENKFVVGVGNIYANEVLFQCAIHPLTPAGALTETQCIQLTDSIKQILARAIEQGGTTLRDFTQPDGKPGYFAQTLHVYGRAGEPCDRCTTPIESLRIGQRNSFFCPHCQPLMG
ncbi:MAG: bifunctional DNA-formamidopyrimidine glycosylase/DNA-(apurinic or apyrimidinic site) lyase [Plesiomonas sp.]|uniref:bifunctional DNA-formamidopyrimidine glycosylase/DNA-(apurinic or apyrimidinic site) lyase n=1 Tax=Plesiomonas sp. TaxID=2486279 RepID=UPI003F3CC9D6